MTDVAEPSADLTGDRAAAALPQALADRRELAIIAVERTRMPMVVTDARQAGNPIVLANQAFLDLTGYTAGEVLGRDCRFLQGEETCPDSIAQVRAAIAEQREITLEMLNYRKDGTRFWNQLHLSPIQDDDGRLLYFFGSQMDVTKRRRAQELQAAEYRLLREVDHRALNALALVQGIVRLSQSESPERYAAAIQSRVGALARAHALLANQSWKAVSLNRLLEGELQPHGLHRATLQGAEVALSARIVQPLTLALHEMVFNAATHGSLSAPDGSIQIAWREDPADGAIRIDWTETGGPTPADVRPSGFGSSMIKAIVERQLRGKLQMNWRADGLAAELVIPNTEHVEAETS